MIATGSGEMKTARDGRRWTLRPGRPTDGRALARLFADVRQEGRWLIATSSIHQPSEVRWAKRQLGRPVPRLTEVSRKRSRMLRPRNRPRSKAESIHVPSPDAPARPGPSENPTLAASNGFRVSPTVENAFSG